MFMNTATPDGRPAVICDDVIDMVFSDSKISVASDAQCAIRLQNVKQAWIRNCQPLGVNDTFLQVEGKGSSEIILSGNDLRRSAKSFVLDDGATKDVVSTINNIK